MCICSHRLVCRAPKYVVDPGLPPTTPRKIVTIEGLVFLWSSVPIDMTEQQSQTDAYTVNTEPMLRPAQFTFCRKNTHIAQYNSRYALRHRSEWLRRITEVGRAPSRRTLRSTTRRAVGVAPRSATRFIGRELETQRDETAPPGNWTAADMVSAFQEGGDPVFVICKHKFLQLFGLRSMRGNPKFAITTFAHHCFKTFSGSFGSPAIGLRTHVVRYANCRFESYCAKNKRNVIVL